MLSLREIFEKANNELIEALRRELTEQGHHLTGALEQSIEGEIAEGANNIVVTTSANNYGGILDAGTSPGRIPFSGVRTGAGHSQYIEALRNYWIQRGLGEAEALRAAFATAHAQLRDGMPTTGSFAYSSNGRRTNFIEEAATAITPTLDETIFGGIDALVDDVFTQTPNERL